MTVSILVTRPRPAADRFADRVRDRLGKDYPVVVSPLIGIETIEDAVQAVTRFGALVITSAHAVPVLAGLEGASDRPCYCVGAATACAARAAGLDPIDGGGTAEMLLRRIVADAPRGPILYLRGEHVASDLARGLSDAGLETHQAIVYRQLPRPLSGAARKLLSGAAPVVVPLFSPRTARLFFETVDLRAPLLVATISRNVAANVPAGVQCHIACRPDADAMLEAVAALASQAKRVESGQGPQ